MSERIQRMLNGSILWTGLLYFLSILVRIKGRDFTSCHGQMNIVAPNKKIKNIVAPLHFLSIEESLVHLFFHWLSFPSHFSPALSTPFYHSSTLAPVFFQDRLFVNVCYILGCQKISNKRKHDKMLVKYQIGTFLLKGLGHADLSNFVE